MATHLYADPLFLQHDAGVGHPESPGRLARIEEVLARAPLAGLSRCAPREASPEELTAVHSPAYLRSLSQLAGTRAQLDPDTAMSEQSHAAALRAAGAAVQAALDVLWGRSTNAFALVRPPGHHAERDHAMGFCLFNNVAIAAEAARRAGAQRVLIVDWDVHHGNGTQHAFYGRSDVLYMSSHQYPFYPGTGAMEELGQGAGRGFTVNAALPAGRTDADFGAIFEEVFLPVAQAFAPDLVLVSAGFDAHRADPLGQMRVTERGFAAMCGALAELAPGKLALVLEGGYDLDALAASVHACLEVLATGRREAFPPGVEPDTAAVARTLQGLLRPFWPTLPR